MQKNMEAIQGAAAKLEVPIHSVVSQSQVPHAAIVSEAEKIRPDLIIMGRRGKIALARLLMGSVTARVIGHSPRMSWWCLWER